MTTYDFSNGKTVALSGGYALSVEKVCCFHQKAVCEDAKFGSFAYLPPGFSSRLPSDYVEVAPGTFLVKSISLEWVLNRLPEDLPMKERLKKGEEILAANIERAKAYYRGEWRYLSVKASVSHPVLGQLFDGEMKPHAKTLFAFPSYDEEAFLKYADEVSVELVSKLEGYNSKAEDGNTLLGDLKYAIRRLKNEKGDADVIAQLEKDAQDIRDRMAG